MEVLVGKSYINGGEVRNTELYGFLGVNYDSGIVLVWMKDETWWMEWTEGKVSARCHHSIVFIFWALTIILHCLEPPAHQSDSHNIQHDIFERALTCGAKRESRAQSQNCRERCTYRWFSAQLFGFSSRPCLIARGVGCLWSIQSEVTRSRCKMVCAWRVLRVPLRCHAKAQPPRNASLPVKVRWTFGFFP